MSVQLWMWIWKICLVAVLGAFAVMAVIVSIGGAHDLRRLFRRLADEEQE